MLAVDSPEMEQGFNIPELHQIEYRAATSKVVAFPTQTLKVLSWNVQHGKSIDKLMQLPHFQAADVLMLTEVDKGMVRSGNRHITRYIAEKMGYHYAYVTDFLEDKLGISKEQTRNFTKRHSCGMTGKAILSRYPLENVRAIRLPQMISGIARKERRLGSQVVLMADVETRQGIVSLACCHLASHASPPFRRLQVDLLLDVLPRRRPCLLGGDLNSSTLNGTRPWSFLRIPFQLLEDSERFISPQPYEPMFRRLTDSDFQFAYFNDRKPTWFRSKLGKYIRARLDWYCGRNLVAMGAETVSAVGDNGERLSDHDGIWIRCRI